MRKDFATALSYLSIWSSKYPVYVDDCPSCQQEGEYERDEMFAECYENLGRLDDAILILKKYFFPNHKNGMYICKQEELTKLLLKKYAKDSLRESLQQGINNINIDEGRFYMEFMGFRYDISEFDYKAFWDYQHILRNTDYVLASMKLSLQNSILYKLIME